MKFPRSSGILLHPTSLPGRFGIGDIGPAAYRFVDFLVASGQTLWQVLPLGPTGYGDSPYQCFSSFAGNPLLISPEQLAEEGFLTQADLNAVPEFPEGKVDFGKAIDVKKRLLAKAFERFAGGEPYNSFCLENAGWLDDYALFTALKQSTGGGAWTGWPVELVRRDLIALAKARVQLAREIEQVRFTQYMFFKQWTALREYAHAREVYLVGDVPIFVAHDSADVWANPHLFYLEPDGRPTVVAGVPPDYFSATGQLWGNPLYRWDVHMLDGFAWWCTRLRATLALVDIVRLDHFRGFAAYWEIPGDAPTAVTGEWKPGPQGALFDALRLSLGSLPLIAEDLGVITPDVVALRDHFELPGMRILQFAFTADATSTFLPHNYERHTVAYTGTHDNDTTVGWYDKLDEVTRASVLRYTGTDGTRIHWDFIRLVLMSVADTALFPLQDALAVGGEGRMNFPGTSGANWAWRFKEGELTEDLAAEIYALTDTYGRLRRVPPAPEVPVENVLLADATGEAPEAAIEAAPEALTLDAGALA